MENISKGEATRKSIVEQARIIFNDRGIGITLENIAHEMGMSKSRISNHFPTKDGLFMAILKEYETELGQLVARLHEQGYGESLQTYVDGLGDIMDIQFKYRCGIVYLNMLSPSQHELKAHTQQTFQRNALSIRNRFQKLINAGIIDKRILDEPHWSAFLFVYVNLLTQWVIYFDMYDSPAEYSQCKMKYLRGIMYHAYIPYLTAKGKKEMEQLVFS
jgi:AcrR family transcriptional regulator